MKDIQDTEEAETIAYIPLDPATRVLLGAALDYVNQTTVSVLGQIGAETHFQVAGKEHWDTVPDEVHDAQRGACAVALRAYHRLAGETHREPAFRPLVAAMDRLTHELETASDEREPGLHKARRDVLGAMAELRLGSHI